MVLTALDVMGTFAFALSGGTRAVESRLDPFGVVFLAFVAAVSGGMLRDALIGVTPVSALLTWHHVAISVVAGMSCFFAYRWILRLSRPVALFDAIGLGLFCVVGARKALDAGLSPLMAALLGMLTAIGGGLAADVLTARPPMVLRREIYALAALAGAALLTFSAHVGVPDFVAAPIGAMLAIGLRLVALSYDWHLPVAEPR
ncbi:trimeric intracellular cation channel family protein [Prosthecomicrobium sp. N25]|uniref:trimeric intracellular cation channel family protein n=1 Tax=Prosthecomicrobium sp. N25 TaxID=3129254 RepID=UPI0030788C0D